MTALAKGSLCAFVAVDYWPITVPRHTCWIQFLLLCVKVWESEIAYLIHNRIEVIWFEFIKPFKSLYYLQVKLKKFKWYIAAIWYINLSASFNRKHTVLPACCREYKWLRQSPFPTWLKCVCEEGQLPVKVTSLFFIRYVDTASVPCRNAANQEVFLFWH